MNTKFLLMGTTAIAITFSSLMGVVVTMQQDVIYDKIVTKPTEQVQSYFNIKNEVKDKYKYKKYIREDIDLLKKMNFPQEVSDVEIIFKTNTNLDKHLLPLMKFGHWLFETSQERRLLVQEKYEGVSSVYSHFSDPNGKPVNDYIMLGVNGLDNKDLGVYKILYKIFDNDEKKLTSFIFFHEIGHKVGQSLNNENKKVQKIIDIFEKEKKLKLTPEDKQVISTQYSESFGDSFALQMMMKKYPEINFEKTKTLIAGMRLTSGSPTHLTSPGIVVSKQLSSDSGLEEIIKCSNQSALVTTQFYSGMIFTTDTTDFEYITKRQAIVNIIPIDSNSVKDNIIKARIAFSNYMENFEIKPK